MIKLRAFNHKMHLDGGLRYIKTTSEENANKLAKHWEELAANKKKTPSA